MAQDNQSFESTLHDIVYSIDAGSGLRIIRWALYIILLLIVMMLYTATQFKGLNSEEAMDYAQLGRNVSFKGGLVTKSVRPISMWKVSERDLKERAHIKNHPDLFHPPAYPVVLGTCFALCEKIGLDIYKVSEGSRTSSIPAEQWVILPINHFFTILTGWLVFALGKRLFSREIGFFGMTIFFLSNVVWQDSVSGLNISMASFCMVAAVHSMVVAMLNRRDKKSRASWIVPFLFAIFFSAIAFLTRYIAIVIVPGIALFAWLMGGRFRGGTRFALVYGLLVVLLITPWLYRNVKVSGNPLGLAVHSALVESPLFPGDSFSRELAPDFAFSDFTEALKEKWVKNYSEKHSAVIPGLGGGVLMALFLTTFFYHFVRPQVNYLRWGLGISFLLLVFIAGFFSDSSVAMLHAFWPFVILYGLSFFYILIDRLDLGVHVYNFGLKILILILALTPLVLKIIPPHSGYTYPPYFSPIISKVTNMLSEREVLCTDMPWATAWYGDRVSVQLPKNVDDFYLINDSQQYISGLYVTTITKDKPFVSQLLTGPEMSWLPVISGRAPKDFPLTEGVSLNRQDQIFFSDRNRWATGD